MLWHQYEITSQKRLSKWLHHREDERGTFQSSASSSTRFKREVNYFSWWHMRSHISPSLPLRLVIGDNLVLIMLMTSQVLGDAVTGPITQTTIIPANLVLELSRLHYERTLWIHVFPTVALNPLLIYRHLYKFFVYAISLSKYLYCVMLSLLIKKAVYDLLWSGQWHLNTHIATGSVFFWIYFSFLFFPDGKRDWQWTLENVHSALQEIQDICIHYRLLCLTCQP